ncbi:MAG: PfkB family carbohydrate kinase, partial [Ardenticatenaceae bacterium]
MSDLTVSEKPVLVIGGAAIDAKARSSEALARGASVPGQIRITVGGVARNVAECLARLEVPSLLMTVVGDDPLGEFVLNMTARSGVDVSPSLRVPASRTGAFFALLEPGGALG